MGPATTTEPAVRIVILYSKDGPARYMGHLDLVRNYQRAAKRAGVKLAYSQGFNPHPRMTFASPLPTGASGSGELAAFDLVEKMRADEVAEAINPCLPTGIRILEAWVTDPLKGTFGTRIESHWIALVTAEASSNDTFWDTIKDAVQKVLESDTIASERKNGQIKDVRAKVLNITAEPAEGTEAFISMILLQDEELAAKPQDVFGAIERFTGPLKILSLERRSVKTDSWPVVAASVHTDASQASAANAATLPGGKGVITE